MTAALAQAKADALLQKIKRPALLITSDNLCVCNNAVLEKPKDETEARLMLDMVAKYPAYCISAVAVTHTGSGKRAVAVDKAIVHFNPIPKHVLDQYIAEGHPYVRAGAFSIRLPLLQPYIDRIEGDIECVIGLSMALTKKLIAEVQN